MAKQSQNSGLKSEAEEKKKNPVSNSKQIDETFQNLMKALEEEGEEKEDSSR